MKNGNSGSTFHIPGSLWVSVLMYYPRILNVPCSIPNIATNMRVKKLQHICHCRNNHLKPKLQLSLETSCVKYTSGNEDWVATWEVVHCHHGAQLSLQSN